MHWKAALVSTLLLPPAVQGADGRACANAAGVEVVVEGEPALAEICAAAGRALAFLDRYGLRLRRAIRLTTVEQLVEVNGHPAYASYDSRSDAIRLMSYEAIFRLAGDPRMYDEPFDRDHYAGVIAHEIAHAVMYHNSTAQRMFAPPQEYLAHATQLAVLPDEVRAALIRKKKVLPWEDGDAVSDAYLAADPGKFAVKSYLHLTSRADPAPLVQQLLKAQGFSFIVPNEPD